MTERESKYLGAFLHDIGKLVYRAHDIRESHEDLGSGFLSSLRSFKVFNDQTAYNNCESAYKGTYGKTKLADIRTAAGEREPDEKHGDKTRRPFISIFSRVNIGKPFEFKAGEPTNFDEYVKSGVYTIMPSPMEFEVQMPEFKRGIDLYNWKLSDAEQKEMIETHKPVYEKFLEEVKKLRNIENFRAFFTTFFKLCEKYTSSVCSAGYTSIPDITLFDHSRAVASLSVCLEEGEANNECLIIYGDISGIQSFIYKDIAYTEHPAKTLRGRSFYIRLVAETVANYLMRKFDVWDANILICSGGHFILVVPNNSKNQEELANLERKINSWFIKEFAGDLMMLIASVECSGEELYHNFGAVYDKVAAKMVEVKRKKGFSILDEVMNKKHSDKNKDDLFRVIGEKLPKCKYLIEIITNECIPEKDGFISFKDFGVTYKLSADNYPIRDIDKLSGIHYAIVHNIENTNAFGDADYDYRKDYSIGYSFKFTGSYIPMKNYEPMTFEDLSKIDYERPNQNNKERESNYALLGIARMDVDSLGKIFSEGLRRKEGEFSLYTLSRIANLSRELDHFFSGFVPKIAERYCIYLTYAGGDDLFAVGSWINIMLFAIEVRERFRQFMCYNPNITISCGIAFGSHHFPISRFASYAGDEEEKAKNAGIYKNKEVEYKIKNRVSAFSRPVKWETLSDMLEIGRKLLKIVSEEQVNDDVSESGKKNEQLPRSFIHHLLTITQNCFRKDGSLDVDKVHQAMSKIHYAFARRKVNAEEIEKKAEERKLGYKTTFAEYFMTKDATERKNWFYNFIIPASYVLLKTRKSDD